MPGQGGATWAVLQYVLGLGRLGHDVLLVDEAARPPATPTRAGTYFARGRRAQFGLEGRAALLTGGDAATVGMPYAEAAGVRARAPTC